MARSVRSVPVTQTDTNLVGTLLERRYRVDRLLARGGMSAVYRGLDTRLDRQVAIKIMDPRFADDRSFVERFEREARSAARLHHPHVVAVHDQGVDTTGGEESTRAFLVMELVDGGTLRDLMDEQGPLDIPLALSVAEPVLSALAAAHHAGLVHRDVKPENVLIGRGGTVGAGGVVKVADFGLVRAVASAGTTSSSVILGTVAYLSPEQVTTGMTTSRGDVYSAGILLYEMLTGQPPYTGDTALSVAYRHVNDDVPRPSELRAGIPPAVDELILRATRRDPEARPVDAGVFLAELNHLRTELGIPAVTIPVPPPPDGDRVSDVERTMPGISGMTAIPAIAPIAAGAAVPSAGPRGTRALTRAVPLSAPPPPLSPPVGMHAPAGPPPGQPPTQATRPNRRGRFIALAAVAVLLLGGLIGTGAWLLSDSGVATVPVPSLAGKSQAEAGNALRDLKLTPKYSARERHNSVPSSQVIRTEPAAGSQVQPGSEVTVVISSGRPSVPDIKPATVVALAEQAIKEQQLEPRRGGDEYSSEVPKGAVVKVNPPPATSLDIGSVVTITLSKGPAPQPVPNVVGKNKDDAFKALRAAGFDPVQSGEEASSDVAAGSVTRTDPPAGTTVTNGSKRINVWVSSSVVVPDVRYKSFDEAVKILTDAGFAVDAKGHGHGGFNFVLQQSPDPGTTVQAGSKVQLRGVG
jgi:beta-lactam-binding protein with PASTA domain/serine/threonine protein kinase